MTEPAEPYAQPRHRRWLAAALARLGDAPVDADALLEAAMRANGTAAEPATSVQVGLRELCASLASDGRLHALGRFMARQYLTRLLTTNLRCASEPAGSGSLQDPLIIVGLHRSGTTRLHHLLSLDPRARYLPAWRTMRASPVRSSRALMRQGNRDIRTWRWLAPEADARHRHRAVDPEEEGVLLATTFHTAQLYETFPVPGYLRWVLATDLERTYEFLARRLRAFEPHLPGQRWVLKYPGHLLSLDTLLRVIPSARVIHTHRDPVRSVCSYVGLLADTHAVMTPDPLRPQLVDATVWRCEQAIHRSIQARSRGVGAGSICDVGFSELVHAPIAVVRRVYERFEIPWSGVHEARMVKFLATPHVPGPSEPARRFGLDEAELGRRLQPYVDCYASMLA